jgi:uncharacterized protein
VRIYLDSSAIVKLVQREPETAPLRRWLRRTSDDRLFTSAIARVEVVRSVLAGGGEAVAHARRQLAQLDQVSVDRGVLDDAASLAPELALRSLDAIHVASARAAGSDLRVVVTYDRRMAEACAALRMPIESPG